MEDADGGLNFDFEGGLENVALAGGVGVGGASGPTPPLAALPAGRGHNAGAAGFAGGVLAGSKTSQGRKNYRQTVCRHWLRGLCMKGEACGFLHQYDKSRMPVCRFFAKFGECREPDCIYKHTNEDIKECNMYKLGFCPNGPDCRYRHQKIQAAPPAIEHVLQKLQLRVYAPNGGHHGKQQQRQNQGHGHPDGSSWQHPPAPANLGAGGEDSQTQSQQKGQQHSDQPSAMQLGQPGMQLMAANGVQQAKVESISAPLPSGYSRFFIVKSSNRENLNLSVERGLWATHRNNESKLNEAYDSCQNVILIFSVNETRHFQGCAQMMSKIGGVVGGGGWKYAHGTAHYGRNFRLKWLKLCELSFNKTRHLRNSYNDNLPVKISRDCQELEPGVGEQLSSLLYLEPDSELMAVARNSEKRAEEDRRLGGQNTNEELEDPTNIVPYEDNEDVEEDNDSDEQDASSLGMGTGHGRGRPMMRGPNQMWPPHKPGLDVMERGRSLGLRPSMGFRPHPDMGVDGFRLNWMNMEGPGMPPGEMFGGPPRPFHGPEGPGFGPMDGMGPVPGPYFPVQHPSGGMFPPGGPKVMGLPPHMMGVQGPHPGMMNPGPGGSYYMHGPMLRPNRPLGMQFPPPYPMGGGKLRGPRGPEDSRPPKRPKAADRTGASGKNAPSTSQRRSSESSDHGEYYGQDGGDQVTHGTKPYAGDDDDSESEDEAPRRSRHGEGKKRRRDWDEWENAGASAWEHTGDARNDIRVAAE